MPNFVTSVDIFFKITLALIAAYISYQFGAFKQQNEDIKLVVELAFAKEDRTAAAGVILAAEYAKLDRIPAEFYTSIVGSAYVSGNNSLRAVANTSANEVAQTNSSVAQQVTQALDTLPARVYFHISREADRAKARQIEEALEGQGGSLSAQPVIVPGIEFVDKPKSQSDVRCFRKEECEALGTKLVEFLKQRNIPAELKDFSKLYGNSNKIPRNNFEIWFSPIS